MAATATISVDSVPEVSRQCDLSFLSQDKLAQLIRHIVNDSTVLDRSVWGELSSRLEPIWDEVERRSQGSIDGAGKIDVRFIPTVWLPDLFDIEVQRAMAVYRRQKKRVTRKQYEALASKLRKRSVYVQEYIARCGDSFVESL